MVKLGREIKRFELGHGFIEGTTPSENLRKFFSCRFADFLRRGTFNFGVKELTLARFHCCYRFSGIVDAGYLIDLSTIDIFVEKNL